MPRDFPEADWRHFKRVHQALQERFCRKALDELAALVGASTGDASSRFHRVQEFLRECAEEHARAFDDFRRSTAQWQLAILRRMELLTDEDLSVFSEVTQQFVRGVDALRNAESDPAANSSPPTSSPTPSAGPTPDSQRTPSSDGAG